MCTLQSVYKTDAMSSVLVDPSTRVQYRRLPLTRQANNEAGVEIHYM